MRNSAKISGPQALKARLEKGGILIAPGCYDCVSARMVERAGFEAGFMTGFGASGSIIGEPDYGLMTMNEMATVCANMNAFLNIPLIGDIDTGYGNPLNVYRTVREFERVGMAAVHLEDQVFPKRCGHMEKKAVIPMEEHVEKIQAAIEARDEMLIIARTDSFNTHGLDEALKRLQAYIEAGADIIYADGLTSVEAMKEVCALKGAYKFGNQVEGGKSPILTWEQLEEIGYDIVIYPTGTVFTAAKAMEKYLNSLKSNHSMQEICDTGMVFSFADYNAIVGMEELTDREKRFGVDARKALLKQV